MAAAAGGEHVVHQLIQGPLRLGEELLAAKGAVRWRHHVDPPAGGTAVEDICRIAVPLLHVLSQCLNVGSREESWADMGIAAAPDLLCYCGSGQLGIKHAAAARLAHHTGALLRQSTTLVWLGLPTVKRRVGELCSGTKRSFPPISAQATTVRSSLLPRTRVGKRPWAEPSRGRGCTARHSPWGARRGGPVSGARRPRAGR